MKYCFYPLNVFLLCITVVLQSCSYKVYVVRHAEKATQPANDPMLTADGAARADALKEILSDKKIIRIYSTNTKRTMKTVEPLALQQNLAIINYPGKPDASFIDSVKQIRRNQLIAGHSNTVDDIVNMLAGRHLLNDLPETIYDNLFVVKIYKGKRAPSFTNLKYGKRSAE
ncbi:MAG: histidine phosphatase family protein [Chitinophagaceae bacterium]|nr:MAG: histidine phosphatase family protein [Chitinophagaceae bacterium]